MTRTNQLLATASAIAMAAISAAPAFAAGTLANTTITNTVSVAYTVGSVAQTAKSASNDILIDRKINLTVAAVGTTTTNVSPGQTAAITTFLVTNNSNAPLDFGLSVAQQVGGAGAHSNTDSFDVTGTTMYFDTDGSLSYTPGVDVAVTSLDEVAPDTSRRIFVVANVPLGQATGDVAAVALTAQARDGGAAGTLGAISVQTTGANTAGVDTVFADALGATDGLYDGQHSAKNDYTVSAAAVSVSKISTLISDPINGTTNPKMIPGAIVSYCIQVANAVGGADATGVTVSDTVPGQLAYITGTTFLNGTVTGGICNADGALGGSYSGTTVSGTLGTLTAGATKTLYFRATIN
ncbi:MAG: hypothetical protein JWL66_2240 [Sphingomonadales bacterium]|nr:hypothetical protein [Sphingomonadales bacterium]